MVCLLVLQKWSQCPIEVESENLTNTNDAVMNQLEQYGLWNTFSILASKKAEIHDPVIHVVYDEESMSGELMTRL